ncbi:hypothetical protein IAE49_23810 [Kosakonia sp. S58]|nr:hypothetical protein [Kosakonia sp. S57]MBK0089266.1 hypothetical protein [Kosakonia sp. S58]
MIFDPQTVAQATAFVNALRAGKPAHIPAMPFGRWQEFMTTVYSGLGASVDADNGSSVYPALGLA